MKLINIKNNFFQIPTHDLEFYGTQDIYEYFNSINRKCEKISLLKESVFAGEILRTEPLEYKFYTQSFFYWGDGKIGRPYIRVKLKKTNQGTNFIIKPKAGIALCIFGIVFLLQIILSVFSNLYVNPDYKIFIGSFFCLVVIYLFERFQIRILIDNFKKEVL